MLFDRTRTRTRRQRAGTVDVQSENITAWLKQGWLESLGSTVQAPSTVISPFERMNPEVPEAYLSVGRSALQAIRMAQVTAGAPDFSSILDFPSGHGRVMRWLRAAYPQAHITACDLLSDGVDFCAETFGADAVYSRDHLTASAFPSHYDLIWVGSLLTHVDVDRWKSLISLWHDLLAQNGLLVVSTHGPLVAACMRLGDNYGYPEPGVQRLLRAYASSGFGFLEDDPNTCTYGITLSAPQWAIDQLLVHKDFHLTFACEALWNNHQDVIAVIKGTKSMRRADGQLI